MAACWPVEPQEWASGALPCAGIPARYSRRACFQNHATSRSCGSNVTREGGTAMADTPLGYEGLYDAILKGDATAAEEITQAALAAGADPQELVVQRMIPAMDEVGQRFECNEFFVPELLIAARAMKKDLNLLRPLLTERGIEPVGRVVIGTVKGDLHDIGKGLVASMLEGGGFEVIDLGVDVPAQKFLEEAKTHNADIIA